MFICYDACSGGYNHFGLLSLFRRMLRCAIVCTYDPCHPCYGRCLFVKHFAHDAWPPWLGACYEVTFSVLMSFSSMRKYDVLCASGPVLRYFGVCFDKYYDMIDDHGLFHLV